MTDNPQKMWEAAENFAETMFRGLLELKKRKKERQKERKKDYYAKNKEKIKQQRKKRRLEKMEEEREEEYRWQEHTSCTCWQGNPPCTYCTDYCKTCGVRFDEEECEGCEAKNEEE